MRAQRGILKLACSPWALWIAISQGVLLCAAGGCVEAKEIAVREDFAAGYDMMKQANDFTNEIAGAAGNFICNALFWSWMTRGLGGMGRIAEALALIDRAIIHCRETGDCYMEPECLRLKGELLLLDDDPDHAAAEAVLREAARLARSHNAKSWELRAPCDCCLPSRGSSPPRHLDR